MNIPQLTSAYAKLLAQVAYEKFKQTSAELRDNILAFYLFRPYPPDRDEKETRQLAKPLDRTGSTEVDDSGYPSSPVIAPVSNRRSIIRLKVPAGVRRSTPGRQCWQSRNNGKR